MALRVSATSDTFTRTTNLPGFPCTLMGWFYLSGDNNTLNTLFSYGTTAGNTVILFLNLIGAANQLNFTGVTGGSVALTTWIHVAIVIQDPTAAQDDAFYYENGVLSITSTNLSDTMTAQKLWVGNSHNNLVWNGRFAALKIFGAELTAAEIAREMRSYVPVRRANLNSWYPCVHPTVASNVTDFSGNAYDAALAGAATVEDGPPIAWAPRRRTLLWLPPPAAPAGPRVGSLALAGVGR